MNKCGRGYDLKMNGRYLLMTGAPGSRWSGVANNLHSSPDFDQTDDTEERSFSHHNGLVHGGAYFDPKMEFGFSKYNWGLPFYGEGVRLIKSHTLSTHMNYFKDYPIVMVLRNDYECWTWWNECGGFDIPYPSYEWYKNQDNMFAQITLQNMSINSFIYNNRDKVTKCKDNFEVLDTLELNAHPKDVQRDEYIKKDVSVYVYRP